jgi:pSer/pThr/pTyr-binding forkhead associated (FHA) protein
MPRLVAQSPEFEGKSFDLTGPEITVGRVEDNKVQVEHASVSGHHAVLKLDALDYVLKDLDSTNGTRVNGEKITEQKLRRNDVVRLGNLHECNSVGRPEGFVNASPITKKARGAASKAWVATLSLLALVAAGAIGYFVYVLFFTDHLL